MPVVNGPEGNFTQCGNRLQNKDLPVSNSKNILRHRRRTWRVATRQLIESIADVAKFVGNVDATFIQFPVLQAEGYGKAFKDWLDS